MCRLAAYSGSAIYLQQFITSGDHSLYQQSWQPEQMQEAKLNADGYGFAWYDSNRQIRCYRDPRPIWNDPNLSDLSTALQSDLWLAYVRSATPGQGSGNDNLQPFVDQYLCFFHNGYIDQFDQHKPVLLSELKPSSIANIQGNTDSEYLFALFNECYDLDKGLLESGKLFYQRLKPLFADIPLLLNCIISDGKNLLAIKSAFKQTPPSLYYLQPSSNTVFIASEPFDDRQWESIPNHHLLYVTEDQACHHFALS